MLRFVRLVPAYRKHRPSGRAVVPLSGQCFYFGLHGTKVSRDAYCREVAEWLARGRRPQEDAAGGPYTCIELIAAYKRHADVYYRKNGKVTRKFHAILAAAKLVESMYGRKPASAFGLLKLKAVQQAMIAAGWCRSSINKQVGRIVRMFAWGVSQEMVKADVAQSLREVDGLREARSEAREGAPVLHLCGDRITMRKHSRPQF